MRPSFPSRVWSRFILVALLGLGAWAPSGAQPPPMLTEAPEGLNLTRLPPVLGDPEIKQQLETGLTTTFLLQVSSRDDAGRPLRGGARVEIRYELWDEIYQLAYVDLSGRSPRKDLPSFEALEKHWSELNLRVLVGRPSAADGANPKIKVELDVIPFSRSEQQDTQRWFSDSIDRSSQGNAENAGRVSEERSETLGEVFNLLMATSIQRRAILDFHWQIPVARARPPRRSGIRP